MAWAYGEQLATLDWVKEKLGNAKGLESLSEERLKALKETIESTRR